MSRCRCRPQPHHLRDQERQPGAADLRLKSPDLARLGEELHAQYGDMPDFFEGRRRECSICPHRPSRRAADRLSTAGRAAAGAPAAPAGGARRQRCAARCGARHRLAAGARSARGAGIRAARRAGSGFRPPPPGALVIGRPLRSGQQVYARRRDLVLLAMVSPGGRGDCRRPTSTSTPPLRGAPSRARGLGRGARVRAGDAARPRCHRRRHRAPATNPCRPACGASAPACAWAAPRAGDKLIFEPVAG